MTGHVRAAGLQTGMRECVTSAAQSGRDPVVLHFAHERDPTRPNDRVYCADGAQTAARLLISGSAKSLTDLAEMLPLVRSRVMPWR
jgi:hypothetical protein